MRPYIFSKKNKNYYLNTFTKMTLNIYYQAKLKAFTDLPSPEKTKRRQPKKKKQCLQKKKKKGLR